MTIGSKYIFHESLPSTNSYAAKLIKNETVQEGTIIYTNFQTAGRGQAGNRWESEKKKNLVISLILYPSNVSPQDQFIISKTISLGICDYLNHFVSNVSIKWPNDIYVNNDKIAGILIETSIIRNEIENMIIGIGLNINQKVFKSGSPNPVSLSLITGTEYKPEECLKNLAACLDLRYKQLLQKKNKSGLIGRQVIDSEYLLRLYKVGQWNGFRDSNGSFEGRIISVNGFGQLQIEDHQDRIREYGFKEVEFL
jgi:BirA family transcriptional regulator, biotin operon repressor / biotin---[acetyl-CoA-carboxylase] ligase